MNIRSEFAQASHEMIWVSEIDSAKSMDELGIAESILGNHSPKFEMLDEKIANGFKKILAEEQKAQNEH